ncbi:12126_t:CDS:2, partial [Cetraspora pellucida]
YDNFRNIEEVGKGGFSVVYKTLYGMSFGTYEEVAIKIIKDSHKNKQIFLNERKYKSIKVISKNSNARI